MFAQTMGSSRATATVLTAPGAGAVAVIEIALWDPSDVTRCFQSFSAAPPRSLADTSVGRIVCGRWDGEDVVIVRTAEIRWEIHCHGGTIAVERIVAGLRDANIAVHQSQDQAGIDGCDMVSSAVRRTLLQCRTRKTAGLVLAQLDGRLQNLVNAAQSNDAARRNSALSHIERWKDVADHLTHPWRIAIVGSPNVGKSSLINAFAGLDRSIVSSTPGTTRDLVEVNIVVDGWTFQLIDTAGVRDSADSELEQMGIEQSLMSLRDCDLVCVVIDVTDKHLPPSLLKPIQCLDVPLAILFNKCDLRPDDTTTFHARDSHDIPPDSLKDAAEFSLSALTGAGLPEFLEWLVTKLIPEEPTSETALPIHDQSDSRISTDVSSWRPDP